MGWKISDCIPCNVFFQETFVCYTLKIYLQWTVGQIHFLLWEEVKGKV